MASSAVRYEAVPSAARWRVRLLGLTPSDTI
jgi:hypothetical protein